MENQKNPKNHFVPRHLPWLLGIGMFLVYGLTLNHWVTLLNVNQVAAISGWQAVPILAQPLMLLFTLPLHWLPPAKIPLVLNWLAAAATAIALGLLARSVAILPHDRTETERQREASDYSFLTGWVAAFPPILAVLLAGLQLTFWEHATSFSGESFELVPFAAVIWLLLEYRLDEAKWRLFAAAFICGIGLVENIAFVGFFPIFLTAIIWITGWGFFNLRFLTRMLLCGLIGLMIVFVLPIVAVLSGKGFWGLGAMLHPVLTMDWQIVKLITIGQIRYDVLLLSLATLLPMFAMSIRWSSNFGDSSEVGNQFLKYILYVVYGLFFGLGVWVMFDPPFSPRQLGLAPSLTLYYLAALAVGYYFGYFLLVFGKKASSRRRRPDPALPKNLMWLSPVILTGTFVIAATALALLVYKNLPIVRSTNDDTLQKYAAFATQNLPPAGAILLADDDAVNLGQPSATSKPTRTFLIQAELARQGRTEKFPVVNTRLVNWLPYQRFLHRQYPKQWPELFSPTNNSEVNPVIGLRIVDQLSESNTICYLNPSFGLYFEIFYQEPQGMVYPLKRLPADTLLPPPLDKNLIPQNEIFWSNVTESVSGPILKALAPHTPNWQMNFFDWILLHLHVPSEPNENAISAGSWYARDLDYWGVQLQRAGRLDEAAAQFAAAQRLNPDNINAGINLEFNGRLRAGTPVKRDPDIIGSDRLGKASNWSESLDAYGPFDDINFCFAYALLLAQDNHLFRQAAALFARVRQLDPDDLPTRLQLAEIYLYSQLPDQALEVLHDPLTEPSRFSLNRTNSIGVSFLAAGAYFDKHENGPAIALIQKELSRHSDNDYVASVCLRAYMTHQLYTNALHVVDFKLAQTPNEPQWLFDEGLVRLQMGDYQRSITALTRVLNLQTNEPNARFNRALAYLHGHQLDSARADFLNLQADHTNSYQVAYGLGEVAWQRHDTNEAIRNYQIYLANAPTNTAEATNVVVRLHELGGH